MRSSDHWHKEMYDELHAVETIGSLRFRKLAEDEVRFLITRLHLEHTDKILDVPCGTGRHASIFARKGFSVTGIDISNACIRIARKHCKGRVVLRKGDMRNLGAYQGKFDVVLNLFSSFGYFQSDQLNAHVLRQMCQALNPGGRLVIHLINRDWLMKVFKPVDWASKAGSLSLSARKYDPATKYNEEYRIQYDKKSKRARMNYHRIRLYSKSEMVTLMRQSGLTSIMVFGGMDGSKFNRFRSSHPVYVGQRR